MTLRERIKKSWIALTKEEPVQKDIKKVHLSEVEPYEYSEDERIQLSLSRVFQRNAMDDLSKTISAQDAAIAKTAMDDNVKSGFSLFQNTIPTVLLTWYAQQSFIGYQTSEIIAQHWLIDKACTMPAKDAARNGYEITVNDGTQVSDDVLDAIRKADVKYRLNYHLVEFARKNRIFGVRIAMFIIEYPNIDPHYYEKPFNIKGIKPGSYKGITQIDPYWMTPELDYSAAADPASMFFYEPTWWRVNGLRVHRTHLVIIRNGEVGDILKPSYFYGGVSIPQKMYERVYAAERSANEAPMLLQTKRTGVTYTDISSAMVNQAEFQRRQQLMAFFRDNYQNRFLDMEKEKYEQHDTALADVDTVIMSQYQICAAIAEVPATKLLGTTLKGFNATGEFEEASYHEFLKSIQTHQMSPLLERHHLLLMVSEIAPKFNIAPFSTTPVWNPLDSTTSKGKSENNKWKAETDSILVGAGILSPDEPRKRLANDPESGYNGLISEELSIEDPGEAEANTETNNLGNEKERENAPAPEALKF